MTGWIAVLAGLALATPYDPAALPIAPAPRTVLLDGNTWAPPAGPLRWHPSRDLPASVRAVPARVGAPLRRGGPSAAVQLQPSPTPLDPQGYRLTITPDGATLEANDEAGMRHALDSLLQLRRHGALPTGRIEDAPALPNRWIHVQLPGRTTGGDPEFPRQQRRVRQLAHFEGAADYLPLLDALAEDAIQSRLNGVVIELNGMWRFPSHPELALPEAAPLEALAPWVTRLEHAGVDVIPLLPLFTHQEQLLAPIYPELLLTPMRALPKKRGTAPDPTFWWNPIYDPRPSQTRTILSELLDDIFQVFQPDVVHVGHDEAGALRFVHGIDPVALFTRSVRMAREAVRSRGASLAIWADMLLDGHRVAGAAHGNESGVKTWKAIRDIDEDVILIDWQYHGAPAPWPDTGLLDDVPSLRYLASTGHPVMGASLGRPVTHPSEAERFGRHVTQSARMARVLTDLTDDRSASIHGQLTNQYGWTPGRLSPWAGTDIAGAAWIAGWHGWTGGRVVWPPAPVAGPPRGPD